MENKPNIRNSKFTPANFQVIYKFWLRNCVNSNESVYNLKRITKRSILEQSTNITDPNLMEKRVQLKSGSKVIFTAPRTESVRKLHESFNEMHTPVSLSLFFRYKPYYCVRPTEKEKQSCLCTNCLNPHLLLQPINIYRKSEGLPSHDSLTGYINRILDGESFEEADDNKLCKFYTYQRITENYIGKGGKPVEFSRTARVDECKPVQYLVNLIKDGSDKYLKHRTYVDTVQLFFR